MTTPTTNTSVSGKKPGRDPAHRSGRHRRDAGPRLVPLSVKDAAEAGMPTDTTPPDRSETIFAMVWYLLVAGVGVWLVVKFGGSADLVRSSLHALGYGLAGPGVWMAARELRRLFEPEVVADIEAEEAEREERARARPATLVSVVCFWVLDLLLVGGFVAYLLDDSGLHGEKTLFTTLVFAGVLLAGVVCAIEVTARWWRRRKARGDQPSARSTPTPSRS